MKREFRFKVDVPKYIYPTGKAGEKFSDGLKKGVIYAAYCGECDNYMMPPSIYCPRCFSEIKQFREVTHMYLDLYTVVLKDFYGRELDEPVIYGFIRFEVEDKEVEGGLIHRIHVDNLDDLILGAEVEPVFKDVKERRGIVTDILYFRLKSD